MTLCPAHRRAADEWIDSLHDLVWHPSMRSLDNGRRLAISRSQNAYDTIASQVSVIRKQCKEGRGCAANDLRPVEGAGSGDD